MSLALFFERVFFRANIINGLVHWVAFERQFRGFSRGVVKTFFDVLGASVIMGSIAYVGLNIFAPLLDTTSLVGIFLQGFGAGLVAILAGIVILSLLKNRELFEIWRVVHGKFWKAKVIATDPEIV